MNIFQKFWVKYLQKPYSLWQLRTHSPDKPLKLVVGASATFFPGWIHTDVHILDVLDRNNWDRYFKPASVDAVLAEHVWEHLTPEQGKLGFENVFHYLKPGGYFRIAVPDGYHTSPDYIEMVKPGGTGNGADDHKILYNYQTMSAVLKEVGYEVSPLEYFDENGSFHRNPWAPEKGMVLRSYQYDTRNKVGIPVYTSLIIDAYKPS